MTIKYFCDVCEIEVENPAFSLDMTGKILCAKHFAEHQQDNAFVKYSTTFDEQMKRKIKRSICGPTNMLQIAREMNLKIYVLEIN